MYECAKVEDFVRRNVPIQAIRKLLREVDDSYESKSMLRAGPRANLNMYCFCDDQGAYTGVVYDSELAFVHEFRNGFWAFSAECTVEDWAAANGLQAIPNSLKEHD